MKRKTWKARITAACREAGTYKPYFDSVIDTLSRIMEQRDIAIRQFEDSGGQMVVEHTNKGGSTNMEKNPAYVVICECNRDALAYWRDLGLTPAGLRKINEQAIKAAKSSPLAEALRSLG